MLINMNSKEELYLLNMNMTNVVNELDELVLDNKPKGFEKKSAILTNLSAHVGAQYGHLPSDHRISNNESFCINNSLEKTFPLLYPVKNELPVSMASGKSFSPAFGNNFLPNYNLSFSGLKRRASAADAEHMGCKFRDTCLGIAESLASSTVQLGSAKEIDNSKNASAKLMAPFSITYNKQYVDALNQNSFSNEFYNAAHSRRASAADIDFSRVHFGKGLVNDNEKASFLKRRASAADAESLQKSYTGKFQHSASLLNAAVSDHLTPYWHVGPELNVTGAFKKQSQPHTTLELYEFTKVDDLGVYLKSIGIDDQGNQKNDVLRLFNLIRQVNVCLNTEQFKPESAPPHEPSTHFENLQQLMPNTMNIRKHIKHIVYKCNGFTQEKSKKLDEYHSANREKYFECSRSIYVIRKLTKQLEAFKTADFEHRKGVFVHSFGAAKAKNLEILLTQLIEKIRECNTCIAVYRWSIQKNIRETGLTSLETLQKAVAIVAAMKSETEDIKNNQYGAEVGAWGGTEICKTKEHNFPNNDGDSIDKSVISDLEFCSSRNATRFVGTFI